MIGVVVSAVLVLAAPTSSANVPAQTSCDNSDGPTNVCTKKVLQGNVCVTTYAPAGTKCDDGDPCSFGETCDGVGKCVIPTTTTQPSVPQPGKPIEPLRILAGRVTCTTTAQDSASCMKRVCNNTPTCGLVPVAAGTDCGTTSDDVHTCQARTCNASHACVVAPVPAGTLCGGPLWVCAGSCSDPQPKAPCRLNAPVGSVQCISGANHPGGGPH